MGDSNKQIKDYWLNEYWPELQKANFDSEDKLDTKLFAVASGAIGLLLGTLSFTEKHFAIREAMTALVLFGISIVFNIVYHYIAMHNHQKQFDEIIKLINGEEETDEKIRRKIKYGNTVLTILTTLSMGLIVAGFFFFSLYIKSNIK